jgi:glycolate oxidase FAD binding subunit
MSQQSPALLRITDRVRAAIADCAPLRIRGGGTKDFYGGPLIGDILETSELSGVTAYEPSELFVTAQAGTRLAELEDMLLERGQCLPFEPPRFGAGSTIGGVVAAGLSGPARARTGSARDFVLGASLLDGRAQLLTFGGQVMKNVAGYDISRVLAGSLGTLGLVVEVSLRVLPIAPAETTLAFECSQEEALRRLNAWGGQALPLDASIWTKRGRSGLLTVRLRGAQAAVSAAARLLDGTAVRERSAREMWESMRDQSNEWFGAACGECDLWRVSVPQTAPVLPLAGAPSIEWHGGLRWYQALPGGGGEIRAAAKAARGHATLFRRARSSSAGDPPDSAFDEPAPTIARVHRALKIEFDPRGIFNRRRLHPDF